MVGNFFAWLKVMAKIQWQECIGTKSNLFCALGLQTGGGHRGSGGDILEFPKRRNMRLKDYDYSRNGAYFITICTHNRQHLLGTMIVGAALAPPDNASEIVLTEYGKNVKLHIESLHRHYDGICVNKYVIMPNHIHTIVVINTGGASAAPTTTLGNLIRGFKSGVSRECGFSIWQRGYHDHIIRNEDEYQKIWEYIDENPMRWTEDKYF